MAPKLTCDSFIEILVGVCLEIVFLEVLSRCICFIGGFKRSRLFLFAFYGKTVSSDNAK